MHIRHAYKACISGMHIRHAYKACLYGMHIRHVEAIGHIEPTHEVVRESHVGTFVSVCL